MQTSANICIALINANRMTQEMYTNLNPGAYHTTPARYQVQYIYIGSTERRDFSEEQLQNLQTRRNILNTYFKQRHENLSRKELI